MDRSNEAKAPKARCTKHKVASGYTKVDFWDRAKRGARRGICVGSFAFPGRRVASA
jgi:hypothetical protein